MSSQVIGEVCCNLIKKAGFSETEVMEIIDEFYRLYQVIPIDRDIFHEASHLRSVYSFSYWDSFIVSAAIEAGVNTLYSEDMQHGLKIKGLTIINPF
ncbi:MAG: PIN domain-containing protein [bacterium]